MTKQLKANGSKITNIFVEIVPFEKTPTKIYTNISLKIVADNINYSYEIYSDERHKDLEQIKCDLHSSITKAQSEMLNVEIIEYADRDYLFVKIQDIGQNQYTGRRQK